MTKVALVISHSINSINNGGSGDSSNDLTKEGIQAAQIFGANLRIGNTPIIYYSADTQRCLNTCRYIEEGRMGKLPSTFTMYTPFLLSELSFLKENYIIPSTTDLTEVVEYSAGNRSASTEELKNISIEWLNKLKKVMKDGLTICVTHDTLLIPLIYNLTDLTYSKLNEYKSKNNWNKLPRISPLTGIAVIVKDNETEVKRVKGLKTAWISADDYDYDFIKEIPN